ncbi:MAG: hypothetical protein AB7V41_05965, partial [Burkholderiaceae bacterium]
MSLELIEASRLIGIKPEQGWPKTFNHKVAAALQSWRKGMERREWGIEAANWRKLIEMAMASNAIEHTTTISTKTIPPKYSSITPSSLPDVARKIGFIFADSRPRVIIPVKPGFTKTITEHHITAPAFAAWLAAQGLEPSPHVAAWFKARGVGSTPVGESIAERNARWLLVWDEERLTRPDGSQARAIARIMAADGVTEHVAKKGLQKAETARAESYRESGAHPTKGVKNSA